MILYFGTDPVQHVDVKYEEFISDPKRTYSQSLQWIYKIKKLN